MTRLKIPVRLGQVGLLLWLYESSGLKPLLIATAVYILGFVARVLDDD